jgi:hypothetical protein
MLEDHPLSAVREWLFITFAAVVHIWMLSEYEQPTELIITFTNK